MDDKTQGHIESGEVVRFLAALPEPTFTDLIDLVEMARVTRRRRGFRRAWNGGRKERAEKGTGENGESPA